MSAHDIDLNELFIFDLANNHQGDMQHARHIISGVAAAAKKHDARGALKFQFRHLETFIHPEFRDRKDVKHIPRFIETGLPNESYRELTGFIREQGLLTMATPFDETSVDLLLELGIDIIKIASCSASDWPLLERVAASLRPVVVSTAGLNLNQIDALVQFFKEREVKFAVMHCVAIYPTPADQLNLNQISIFKNRYRGIPIGWSTHEDQDSTEPVQIAMAKGATLFERHVGDNTDQYELNKYSSTPAQVDRWIAAWRQAQAMCGSENRAPAPLSETESLRSLMRGVYANREIKQGETIAREDVFFAMPLQEEQLVSGQWRDDLVADRDYPARAPLHECLASYEPDSHQAVSQILEQAHGRFNEARIVIGDASGIELSHHYGIERFREFGCLIVDCVNRTYCKKLILLFPRQKHPYHFHKRKEETFQLLSGDLEVEIDGRIHSPKVGETLLIKPNAWHKFHTLHGAIFEEVSTTHYNDDSFYEDDRIAKLPREARKTIIRKQRADV